MAHTELYAAHNQLELSLNVMNTPSLQLKFDHDHVQCWKAFCYGTGQYILFRDMSGRTKWFLYISPKTEVGI